MEQFLLESMLAFSIILNCGLIVLLSEEWGDESYQSDFSDYNGGNR